MPGLTSLEEPPDSHEATAGRCHPPPELTFPHSSRYLFSRSLVPRAHNVTAVTATQTWAGSLQPHGATHGRNTKDPSRDGAHVHDSAATPSSPSSRLYSQGISASLRNMWPLPIPPCPQQPLHCPSSAQNVPHLLPEPRPSATLTSTAALSSKQEPDGGIIRSSRKEEDLSQCSG